MPTLSQVENDIRIHMQRSKPVLEREFKDADGRFYVIKYLPTKRLNDFLVSRLLYASGVSGYTWGDGVYVAPLSLPLSTMMYGRIGIVGRIDPANVYDASDAAGKSLYQQWIRYQWRWYDLLTTTIHADRANRYLRNLFRTHFQIDCVFFRPDQACAGYVGPWSDYWFALTHWATNPMGRRVAFGASPCVLEPEWCVVGCEEFEARGDKCVFYDAMIGPALRGTGWTRTQVVGISPVLAGQVKAKYIAKRANPNEVPLVVRY